MFEIVNINGKRHYKINGKFYKSVTTIIDPGTFNKNSSTLYADIGTIIHYHAFKQFDNLPVPDCQIWVKQAWVQDKIDQSLHMFREFLKDYNPKVLQVEQFIYDDEYQYAGTYDMLAEIDGETILVDLKTGNYYNHYPLQIAAYWRRTDPNATKAMILQTDTHPDRNPDLKYKITDFSLNDLQFYEQKFLKKCTENIQRST